MTFSVRKSPTGSARPTSILATPASCGGSPSASSTQRRATRRSTLQTRPSAGRRRAGCRRLIFLAAVDSVAQLDDCRKLADAPTKGTVYVALPGAPLSLNADKARELIAVRQLLEKKDPQTHAYEVLENKLTRLREDLAPNLPRPSATRGSDQALPSSKWDSRPVLCPSVPGASCCRRSAATSTPHSAASPASAAARSTSGRKGRVPSGTRSRTSSKPS